jgi:catechol-2,3-dioxygenase
MTHDHPAIVHETSTRIGHHSLVTRKHTPQLRLLERDISLNLTKGAVMSAPSVVGVHHLKLPVIDLGRSREWYESVLGLRVQTEFRDDDGVVRGVVGTLTDPSGSVVIALALRQNPEVARQMSGFDPLALSVEGRSGLQAWVDHLVSTGLERPQTNDRGNVLYLHDPDGLEIRLFNTTN